MIDKNELNTIIYTKKDIMELFSCESDKALKILKLLFYMNEANKIGKEYYVTKDSLVAFLESMKGKELMI